MPWHLRRDKDFILYDQYRLDFMPNGTIDGSMLI